MKGTKRDQGDARKVRSEYTARQAGAWLGVTRISVGRYIKAGLLPARLEKLRGSRPGFIVSHDDLVAFEQRAQAGQRLLAKHGRPIGRVDRGAIERLAARLNNYLATWEKQEADSQKAAA